MKKTYVILLYGAVHHMPQAICGKSRKTYGHAVFVASLNAHVFRMSSEEWEPDPKNRAKRGAGIDIFENTRRRGTLSVICELSFDPRAANFAMAEEFDRLQMQVAQLDRDLALLPQVEEAAAQLLVALRGEAPPIAQAGTQAPATAHPKGPVTVAERLDAIPFRVLRDLAKTINLERPDTLKVAKLKTMAVMVDTLAGLPFILEYLPAVEAELAKAA